MKPQAQSIGTVDAATSRGAIGWELPIAGLGLGLLSLAIPVFVLHLFDWAVPTGQFTTIAVLGFSVLVAVGLCGIVGTAVHRLADYGARQRARDRLMKNYRTLITGPLSSEESVETHVGSFAPTTTARPRSIAIGVLCVQFVGMVVLTGLMAIIPAILGGLAISLGYLFAGQVGRRNEGGRQEKGDLATALLDHVWVIKAMGAERLVLRHSQADTRSNSEDALQDAKALTLSLTMATAAQRIALIASVLAGTVLVVNGLLTGGQFVSGCWLTVMIVATAHGIGRGLGADRRAGGTDIHTGTAEVSDRHDLPPLPLITGNILLNNLSYSGPADRFRPAARQFLDRVQVAIDAGEMVRITADDPQRASACLRLIAGLDIPDQGQLLIDGHALSDFRSDSVRRQIAYVPPTVDLFPGTVMENITGFDAGRSVDAIGAARLVGLDRTVSRLTNKYDTLLMPDAPGYPSGFCQHVGLARALALKPKILLLDFATENLDSRDFRGFSEILERLKGRVTVVFAGSQMGLRNLADRTLDLDDLKADTDPKTTRDAENPQDKGANETENQASGPGGG